MISFADWNMTLMPLLPENDLLTADIVQWFSVSLLGHHLGPPRSLVKALGQLVNQPEAMLCQQVHALVRELPDCLLEAQDEWLTQRKMTVEKYVKITLLTSKQVDYFFLLCVAYKFGIHMALVYMDGIYSTCKTGVFQENDLMLAQTTDGFREVLAIKDDIQLYETLGDSSCLDTHWTSQPPLFVAPVVDPIDQAEDAG